MMKLGTAGKKLIQTFEGCRLNAYDDMQPNIKITSQKQIKGTMTIGFGHTGNVKIGQVITQAQADALFDKDIQKYVDAVNALGMELNQNQFDALVSFCYNAGPGNLNRLCSDKNIASISKCITAYNKSGGQVLNGLERRRTAEKELFNTPVKSSPVKIAPVKSTAVKSTTSKKATPIYHTVIPGDVVSKIAVKNGVSVSQIKNLNKLDDKCKIQLGQKLRVK